MFPKALMFRFHTKNVFLNVLIVIERFMYNWWGLCGDLAGLQACILSSLVKPYCFLFYCFLLVQSLTKYNYNIISNKWKGMNGDVWGRFRVPVWSLPESYTTAGGLLTNTVYDNTQLFWCYYYGIFTFPLTFRSSCAVCCCYGVSC